MLLAEKQMFLNPAITVTGVSSQPASQTRRNRKLIPRVIGFLLCLVVANMIIQAIVVQKNNEITKWKNEIRDLERKQIELRIEMAGLESFERIQTMAKNELGMREAGPKDYQLIAASPIAPGENIRHPYEYHSTRTVSKSGLWAKLSAWLGSLGETMAQTL